MVEHISNGEKKVKKEKKKRGIYDSAYVGKGTHAEERRKKLKRISMTMLACLVIKLFTSLIIYIFKKNVLLSSSHCNVLSKLM